MSKKNKKTNWELEVNLRAWKDPKFKRKLLENPQLTLKEMGYPQEFVDKVRIIEAKPGTEPIVLYPEPQKASELSEGELRSRAAGAPTEGWNQTCHHGWNEGSSG